MNADVVYLNKSLWYEFPNFVLLRLLPYLYVNGNTKFEFELSFSRVCEEVPN